MENKTIIKIVEPSDAPQLALIYAPYVEKTAVSFEYDAPSADEFCRRIKNTLENYPYIAAVRNGEILGYAYLSEFSGRPAYIRNAEASIYIRNDCRRCGIGKKLYNILENIAALQNILNITVCIASPEKSDEFLDDSSLLFHEYMRYKPSGKFHNCGYKFGNWYNVVWAEKTIGTHTASPKPFIAFPLLSKDELRKSGIDII